MPWLEDRKWAHIRIESTTFGDTPLNLELKLEVWDSPNSAGVVVDAVRCARLALDRGIGGVLEGPSSYFMKSPPVQYDDREAEGEIRAFVENGDPSPRWTSPAGTRGRAESDEAALPRERAGSGCGQRGANGSGPAALWRSSRSRALCVGLLMPPCCGSRWPSSPASRRSF